MAYDIKGTLHHIGDVQQVTEKFKKREIVLLVPDGRYPQHVPLELTGDSVSLVDGMRCGEELRVTFNVRGRESRKPDGSVRYWLSLNVWKLERTSEPQSRGAGMDSPDQPNNNTDDLPF